MGDTFFVQNSVAIRTTKRHTARFARCLTMQLTLLRNLFAHMLSSTIKRTLRQYRKPLLIVLAICVVALTAIDAQLPDFFVQQVTEVTTPVAEQNDSIWLNDYVSAERPIVIAGVSELSGLTWNDDSKTLFAVLNRPPRALEMSTDGTIYRTILLNGYEDVEGIAWLGDDRFLIIDERRHNVTKIALEAGVTSVDFDDSQQLRIGIGTGKNKGFEGIAWQPDTKTIWIAKERDPMAIYEVQGFVEGDEPPQIDIDHDETMNTAATAGNSDLSGLHFDPRTKHLLVLSHESARIAEIDLDGNIISTLSLGWLFGDNVPQAEGVTMNDAGDIFVVSEPNILYRYTKKPEASAEQAK